MLEKAEPNEPLTKEQRQTAEEISNDPAYREGLRAGALKAHEEKHWELAANLWKTMILSWPEDEQANFYLAYALDEIASIKKGQESANIFKEAYEVYERTVKFHSNKFKVFNNWGLALAAQAKIKEGEDADKLYAEACKKYDEAIKYKPDYYEAFNNWGNALIDQANLKEGVEADELFELARKKYIGAINLSPDKYEPYLNLSVVLLSRAKRKKGEEREKLFQEAYDNCLKTENIKPGYCAYNLACIESLRGNSDECRKWLNKGREFDTLEKCEKMKEDNDLDNVRGEAWFKEFMKEVCGDK